MRPFRYLFAPLAACLLLSGCLMNSTRPLPAGGTPNFWRAVVVYGIGVEGEWDAQRKAVYLEEYSLENQAITGGCFFYNRTEASIPSAPGPVRYVAFDVPAGTYAYNGLHAEPPGMATAFIAPAGRTSISATSSTRATSAWYCGATSRRSSRPANRRCPT